VNAVQIMMVCDYNTQCETTIPLLDTVMWPIIGEKATILQCGGEGLDVPTETIRSWIWSERLMNRTIVSITV